MPTWSLTVETDAALAEERAAELFELGASGVEVRDGEGDADAGVRRCRRAGRAVLVAWFAARAARRRRAPRDGGDLAEVPDEDWGEGWKKDFRPLDVGRVRVRPSWIDAPPPPGMRGGGARPRDGVRDRHPPDHRRSASPRSRTSSPARPGVTVLDVGTGSGLLAIAARKLGARRVAANDDDPVAVEVARENAARNGAALELTGAAVDADPGHLRRRRREHPRERARRARAGARRAGRPGRRAAPLRDPRPQEEEVRARPRRGGPPARSPGGDRRDGEWSLLALGEPA